MTNINIALAATNDWFLYTMTTICSILINSADKDNYSFYIMSNGFTDKEKADFLKLNSIKNSNYIFLEMNDSVYDRCYKNPLGNSTNYRLNLASRTNVDKILYLDSDIIVNSDIAPLYETDIKDYYIAAVEDKCSDVMRTRIVRDDNDFIFVNAGVVLMNLNAFRENNLEQKFIEYMINDKKNIGCCDQDAINGICYKHIKYLPLKYNLMVGSLFSVSYNKDEYDNAMQSPVVIHYALKPWCYGFVVSPFLDKWNDYNKIVTDLLEKELV